MRSMLKIGLKTPSASQLRITRATGAISRLYYAVGRRKDAMSENSKIDATLKKIAAGMPSGKNNPTDAKEAKGTKGAKKKRRVATPAQGVFRSHDLPGDPNCPICQGVGYYRLEVPVEHPDFGKLQICTCRQGEVSQHIH